MPKDPLSEAEVTVLVDYLASLKRPPGAAVRPGSTIYHDEGCADCHDTPGEFGSMPGPALAGIGRLRSDTYLEGVILNPGDWFPRTAMPPTVLESPELANLIAYLREL